MKTGIIWKSTSGNYITTAENLATEFCLSSYFLSGSSRHNRSELSFEKKDYSAGLRVEIKKYNEKRVTSQTFEIGRDQVELLVSFLQNQLPSLKNYSSDKIEKAE